MAQQRWMNAALLTELPEATTRLPENPPSSARLATFLAENLTVKRKVSIMGSSLLRTSYKFQNIQIDHFVREIKDRP